MLIRVAKRENLKSEYKLFIDQADKLKRETDGMVNMYKTGSIKATALKLFQDKTKAVSVTLSHKNLDQHLLSH